MSGFLTLPGVLRTDFDAVLHVFYPVFSMTTEWGGVSVHAQLHCLDTSTMQQRHALTDIWVELRGSS